jgi:hypothetical protein
MIERAVKAFAVALDLHKLKDGRAGFFSCGETFPKTDGVPFLGGPRALDHGVTETSILAGKTWQYPSGGKLPLVATTGVLSAPIGVINQPRCRLAPFGRPRNACTPRSGSWPAVGGNLRQSWLMPVSSSPSRSGLRVIAPSGRLRLGRYLGALTAYGPSPQSSGQSPATVEVPPRI